MKTEHRASIAVENALWTDAPGHSVRSLIGLLISLLLLSLGAAVRRFYGPAFSCAWMINGSPSHTGLATVLVVVGSALFLAVVFHLWRILRIGTVHGGIRHSWLVFLLPLGQMIQAGWVLAWSGNHGNADGSAPFAFGFAWRAVFTVAEIGMGIGALTLCKLLDSISTRLQDERITGPSVWLYRLYVMCLLAGAVGRWVRFDGGLILARSPAGTWAENGDVEEMGFTISAFASWGMMIVLLWFAGHLVALCLRLRGWTVPGHCPKCGYDLRASSTTGCPECGWGRKEAEPIGVGATLLDR